MWNVIRDTRRRHREIVWEEMIVPMIVETVQIADPESETGYRVITREVFEPDPPPRFPNADAAKAALAEWATRATAAITGPVPPDEKIAWPAKEAAARAILAGEATADQLTLVGAEAVFTGETVADLCGKIIARADLFRSVVAAVSGIRRHASAQIDASQPTEYEGILNAARITAQQAAAQLGVVIPG